MKKRLLALFALLVLVQLAVPAGMILRRELTLATGETFRFRTAPIDPYDPFRGRYVTLRLEAATSPAPPGESFRAGEWVYALLGEDAEGFARFTGITRSRPEGGAWLRVRVVYGGGDGTVHLKLPFDRYYAEESAAPQIERAYWRHSRRESREAWVTVRVRAGRGVLEELYLDGLPVGEYLARELATGEG